jgi:hypothetical protein
MSRSRGGNEQSDPRQGGGALLSLGRSASGVSIYTFVLVMQVILLY